MKLNGAEKGFLLAAVLVLALTVGFRMGRDSRPAEFTVRTEERTEALRSAPTPAPERGAAAEKEPEAPVNINSADHAELCTLDGIGEVLAERIIAYRQENGPFSCVEEITEIRGIGSGTLEQIRSRITVE